MRAKLQIESVTQYVGNEQLVLRAVQGKKVFGTQGESEDNTFARWTPSAELKMTITNPDLLGKFKPGQRFYVDFVEAIE